MRSVAWHLNLAALTEAELLSYLGEDSAQARFPAIAQARLQGQPVLDASFSESWFGSPVSTLSWPQASGSLRGNLLGFHLQLLEAGALPQAACALLGPGARGEFMQGYVLGNTAVALQWSAQSDLPVLLLLSWLRDRASGVACVMTSNALETPSPAYTEEAAVHVHPGLNVPELWGRHQEHLRWHGREQKLAAEEGWRKAWEALHDLNWQAWSRRGVIVAVPD